MRYTTFILIMLLTVQGLSAKKPTKPVYLGSKHTISFTVTNAGSYAFYNSRSGPKTTAIVASHPAQGYDDIRIYYPAYTFAFNLGYTYRITSLIRVETGLTYMLYGQTMAWGSKQYNSPTFFASSLYNMWRIGYITISVRVALVEYMKRSDFKFSIGPELSLPVNKLVTIDNTNIPIRARHINGMIKADEFTPNINLGLAMRATWGVPISPRVSFDIGPVFDFTNLVMPGKSPDSYNYAERMVFTYYAGLDLTFSFGTFRKPVKKSSAARHI